MKIDQIITTVLKANEYPRGGWVLVRVRTKGGIEGLGECFVPDRDGRAALAARAIIDGSLAPRVLGRDVRDVACLWQEMYTVCQRIYDRRGLAVHALSGVDMAIHDAASKALGLPLCQYLGGRFRERVPVYVSSIPVDPARPEAALDATRVFASRGFSAIKYYGWDGFGQHPRRDDALLRAIGEAAGEGVEIMLDLGRPASLSQAVRMARLIEQTGVAVRWWEEPLCTTDDAEGMAKLRERTDLTLAAGEREITAYAFRELISRRIVDVVQPDLSWVGGLTEGRRIAEMARLWHVPMVPHNWGTMVNFAASIHLVASMPEGFLCEYPITGRTLDPSRILEASPMMSELASEPVTVVQGQALVPSGPGLGIALDEEAVERYSCR